jgi:hypothetical protein
VNPVIRPGERDRLLRPMQGLRWLGVHELYLVFILVVPPPAQASLPAADDHVGRLFSLLEWAVGVAYLRWRR